MKPVTLYILSPHTLHSTIQWPFSRNSIIKLALSLKVLSHPACTHGRPACSYKNIALIVSQAQLRLKLLWLKEDDELALKVCILVKESLPCIYGGPQGCSAAENCPITVRLRGEKLI